MNVKFTKMHGSGNDFILFDEREKALDINFQEMAPKLCHRQLGIGADGILRILPSKKADFKMEIINADGSPAEMCGNGIRCFAKYVFEHTKTPKEIFSVETLAGIIMPAIEIKDKKVVAVEVDMGVPELDPKKIPVKISGEKVIEHLLKIDQNTFKITAVSMGNPHIVIFVDSIAEVDVVYWGAKLETNELFPKRTNVHFVEIISKDEIKVRHWERGVGETFACGTGACASVVAGVIQEKLKREVKVQVPGGLLKVVWDQETNHLLLTGPAITVYYGEINL